MTAGRHAAVRADASLGNNGSEVFTETDFTHLDGTGVIASETIVVEQIAYDAACDVSRVGDPDEDSTFEINQTIGALSQGEASLHTGLTLLNGDFAHIEVADTSGSGANVYLLGRTIKAGGIFVEQNDAVADTNEVARTTGARAQEETVYELVMSGDATLHYREDVNDDGTFEFDAQVASFTGGQVRLEEHVQLFDLSGRSNAESELALQANGGSRDLMILGTIGG